MIIGGDDTPAPPASDLWSFDVRFTLTKSVCKTSEFGDSTAGCHGARSELGDASRETSPTDTQGLSVELCLKKKNGHTHYSSSMRFFSHELRKRRTEW